MRFHDKNSTNPEIFMKWFISVYIQFLQYETEKNGVFTSFTKELKILAKEVIDGFL